MNQVVAIYKHVGETPLEALGRLRSKRHEYAHETLSYAGRLDPMAEGVMLVLVGEANKKREEYLHLNKTYTTEILFGVSTDTFDILGLITETNNVHIEKEKIEDVSKAFLGTFTQHYPIFSSKPIDGVPAFEHARKGRRVVTPTHDVTLFSAEVIQTMTRTSSELFTYIEKSISGLGGDFRQGSIMETWKKMFNDTPDATWFTATLELAVSSGFYVRQYAHDIGKLLGVPACTLSIIRTKVGEYTVDDCIEM